jgi:uroporphyrinogen decarboxylase
MSTDNSPSALGEFHPLADGRTAESALIRAYRGLPNERRPMWMMRQAGRSLPEYRAIRAGTSMLDSCLDPALVTEITLQPVRRHDVDAAIFFSDIVVPLKLAGVGVDIVAGVGPVMDSPVRSRADLDRLEPLEPGALAPITQSVQLLTSELGSTPLIGFAGAPFTLASYLIEGRPSRDYRFTKAMMREDPELWASLLTWAAEVTGSFLRAQAVAGASAVQLFDSWAGALTLGEYQTYAAPYSAMVMAGVSDLPVPRIHFGTKTHDLLVAMRDVGATVMGIDQNTPLDVANDILGGTTPLQGNIDPELLSADWEVLAAHTKDVLRRGLAAPGHVVNLGHGVPKDADPDVLTRLVAFVHEEG